jgi:DNA replication protein DnaC
MLYRFKRIISKKVKNFISNQISKINADIISTNFLIFDDIFPHPLSDWRQNEFLYYLKNIRETKIITVIHFLNIVLQFLTNMINILQN